MDKSGNRNPQIEEIVKEYLETKNFEKISSKLENVLNTKYGVTEQELLDKLAPGGQWEHYLPAETYKEKEDTTIVSSELNQSQKLFTIFEAFTKKLTDDINDPTALSNMPLPKILAMTKDLIAIMKEQKFFRDALVNTDTDLEQLTKLIHKNPVAAQQIVNELIPENAAISPPLYEPVTISYNLTPPADAIEAIENLTKVSSQTEEEQPTPNIDPYNQPAANSTDNQ